MLAEKIFAQVCVRNYSDVQFIAPIRGLILSPSRDTGTWGGYGKASSADHGGVRPRDRDCDPAVDPTMYV